MFNKLSRKIGLTETEIKVILFLAVFLLLGLGYEIFNTANRNGYKEFDYSEQDSLFEFYSKQREEKLKDGISGKKFDSKQEVLDFNGQDFQNKKSTPPLEEKSININSADLQTLVRLPGIGEKTALKIIALRDERGGFKKLEELMDVKGIGTGKFNKIKKFLYIE